MCRTFHRDVVMAALRDPALDLMVNVPGLHILSLIPVVVVYIFGQRYLVEGLMVGGIKG